MSMIKRVLLLASVISLAVASAANSFNLNLYQPTVVNGTTLKPGEAKLELKDNKAIVKQGKTSAEATVKVESAEKKYLYTTIGYKEGDSHQIKDITIAGTTTKLIFE
jgi:outer membrane protein assembly factor BamA